MKKIIPVILTVIIAFTALSAAPLSAGAQDDTTDNPTESVTQAPSHATEDSAELPAEPATADSAELPTEPAAEPDPFLPAKSAVLGATVKEKLTQNTQRNIYLFTFPANGTLALNIKADKTVHYELYEKQNTKSAAAAGDILNRTDTVRLSAGKYYLVISADDMDRTVSYQFTLRSVGSPTSLSLSIKKATLYKGATKTILATVLPANAESKAVTWKSDDRSVATVNSIGIVTAKSAGTAKITAKTVNGITASCTVTVKLYAPKITVISNAVNGVKLKWGKVSCAAKYRVLVKSGDKWKKVADTKSNTYTVKSLRSGKKYTYAVRCLTATGAYAGDYSALRSITYIAAPAAPTLKNTRWGIQVSWKKVSGAAKYAVFRKTANTEWKKIAVTTKAITDYTARRGIGYRYTVRCMDKKGNYISAYNNGAYIRCTR